MKNPTAFVGFMLILMGIMFTAGGTGIGYLGITERNEFKINGISATAIIYDIEYYISGTGENRSQSANVHIVFYTENNEEIQTLLNEYNSSMRIGQEIEITYHKDNPHNVNVGNSFVILMIISVVFSLVGIALLAGAVITIKNQINKTKMQKTVRSTGRLIKANIVGIVEDRTTRINRVHPRILEAEFNGMRFLSGYITNNDIMNLDKHETIDVYIDRNNADNYYVDLESIKR